ncbi:MAG TPA: hypothetical protein VFH77_12985, partial [Streptomyces sp.]|nr:hypothetical protein [Streptomyces sp.]
MTEYGRGPGPGQWRPEEDPLYGDQGWDPYASQSAGYPQAHHPDGAAYGGQYTDPYGQSYPQQHYPQQPFPDQQYADPYATGQLPSYDSAGWDASGYGGQDPYGMQQYPDPYGTGEQPHVPGGYPDPYQAEQAGYPPHGGAPQQPQQPQQPHPAEPAEPQQHG